MSENEFCSMQQRCPITVTMRLVGGKYKVVLLWHLMHGALRYSELHRIAPEATDKMLAQQLREMERDGLITRKVYPVVPPHTEYALTALGRSLVPILDALGNWGRRYMEEKGSEIPRSMEDSSTEKISFP